VCLGETDKIFHPTKHDPRLLHQSLAKRCNKDVLLVALEDYNAELGLQLLDRRTQGRLGNVAGFCSLAEVLVIRYRADISELFQGQIHAKMVIDKTD